MTIGDNQTIALDVGSGARYPALVSGDLALLFYNLAIVVSDQGKLRAIFVRTDGERAISTLDRDAGTYYRDTPTPCATACLQCSRYGHLATECYNRGVLMTDVALEERRKRLARETNRKSYARNIETNRTRSRESQRQRRATL